MARRDFDDIKTKDQLGKPDDIGIFGPFKITENFIIQPLPDAVFSYDFTDVAKWDDADTTWDGVNQDDEWLDYSDANVRTLARVISNNDEFYWNFCYDETLGDDNIQITYGFIDTTTNTCTINTTDLQAEFTSGEVLGLVAYKDSSALTIVTSATLSTTETSGTYTYEMSADGGSNWQTATIGTQLTFTNTGSDLRIRITENAESTGVITAVFCNYNLN